MCTLYNIKMQVFGLILLALCASARPIDHDRGTFGHGHIVARAPTSIEVGTESCTAKDHWVYNSYGVLIRVPYQSPAACDNTYHILESHIAISNWQCIEEDGYTRLYFNAGCWQGNHIDEGLSAAYPNIEGGFNCPD
jgi:hypothetical protein